jgi:hypothetical protein
MTRPRIEPIQNSGTLVNSAELAEIIGVDLQTVNNWIGRGIITRARIGGRQLRNRLFSTEEVYKAALKNELVKLGIPPSPASEAVNALWKDWGKKDTPEGWKVYAALWSSNDKWIVALCSQKIAGGPVYKLGKPKSSEEMELPKQTSALIPFSDVLDRISSTLSELLDESEEPRGEREAIVNCHPAISLRCRKGHLPKATCASFTNGIAPADQMSAPGETGHASGKEGFGF